MLFALSLGWAGAAAAQSPVKAADVLVWSQAERQARFPRMETLLPHRTVRAGGRVHRLPRAKPLELKLTDGGRPQPLDAWLAADRTAGLLVIHDGRIRLERYGPTLAPGGHWAGFSLTKSITSTLYGAAIADGFIRGMDDDVTAYLPELKGSAYDGVKLSQLLTMSSGARWIEDYYAPASDAAHIYTTAPDPGLDPITSYMRRLPREAPPGTKWNYKTGETDLAGILLIRATGRKLSDYLAAKIWRPYGMARPAVWMINAHGDESGGCCFSASLRDWGRFGQFVLDGGSVGGRAILPRDWLATATGARIATGRPGVDYGYFWWPNADGTFDGRGIFGQLLHIDPRRRLVVVLLAAWPSVSDPARAAARTRLIAAIARASEGYATSHPASGQQQ